MPTVGNLGMMNLKMDTLKNPTIMDAIAPFSVKPSQSKERMITGTKVAAMPDQPNITNQKTVRSGDKTDTSRAMINAKMAITTVTILDSDVNASFFISG